MSETKHTPTPWETSDHKDGTWVLKGRTYRGCKIIHQLPQAGANTIRAICMLPPDEGGPKSATNNANAAFIVRAVNAHDELVAACARTAEWIVANSALGNMSMLQPEVPVNMLRAAIAKAEGSA